MSVGSELIGLAVDGDRQCWRIDGIIRSFDCWSGRRCRLVGHGWGGKGCLKRRDIDVSQGRREGRDDGIRRFVDRRLTIVRAVYG